MLKLLVDRAEIDFFQRIQHMIEVENVLFPRALKSICGVDAAYSLEGNQVVAVATLFKNGRLIETSTYAGRFTFPYFSGLFFLHEGPFAVAAVSGLKNRPQLVCFDAHGIAHPRSKGLATICGMMLRIPSIGIAKTKLIGAVVYYKPELSKIKADGKHIGYVTSISHKKRYWSAGYSVSTNGLERIIEDYYDICLKALEEAHRLSKKAIYQKV